MGNKPNVPSVGQQVQGAKDLSEYQFGQNQAAQAASNYDQYNPYGSLNYVQTGVGPNGVPTYSALSNFSPEQAPLWAQTLMSKGIAGGEGTSLLGGANYGFGGQPKDVIGNTASGITGDITKGNMAFMQPFQEQKRAHLDAVLKNQGRVPGDPAYDNAMRSLDTSQSLAAGKIISDAAPFAYKQASDLYTMPALMAMQLGQWGMPQDPRTMYGATTPLQPGNATGAMSAISNATQNQYNAEMGQYQAQQKGFGDLAGGAMALALMSDRRMKRDIKLLAKRENGLNWYSFRFPWSDKVHYGLMADEVELVKPEAVSTIFGIKHVNYELALS